MVSQSRVRDVRGRAGTSLFRQRSIRGGKKTAGRMTAKRAKNSDRKAADASLEEQLSRPVFRSHLGKGVGGLRRHLIECLAEMITPFNRAGTTFLDESKSRPASFPVGILGRLEARWGPLRQG